MELKSTAKIKIAIIQWFWVEKTITYTFLQVILKQTFPMQEIKQGEKEAGLERTIILLLCDHKSKSIKIIQNAAVLL